MIDFFSPLLYYKIKQAVQAFLYHNVIHFREAEFYDWH